MAAALRKSGESSCNSANLFFPIRNHNNFTERIVEDMEHLVLSCLESRAEGNGSIYGRFLLGPFKIGQGRTVATALRRTLLSELQGIAITAVEIKGATHQYSSIVGVRESTLDIVLNLKQVVLTGDIRNGLPAIGYLAVQGPKTARARDLKLPNGIRCIDEDQYIASISASGALLMKFVISAGKNYVSPHSTSTQTLTPSLFQPKIRQGDITPLALRAGNQPLHRLVRTAKSNAPLDIKRGQRSLIRGGRPPRLSSSIGDILVSHAARRSAYLQATNEVATPLPSSVLDTSAKVAVTNGSFRSAESRRLSTSLRPLEESQAEPTVDRETNKLLFLSSRAGAISELPQSIAPKERTNGGSTRRGNIFSTGSLLGVPGNRRKPDKLGDGNRFAEMALTGVQPSSRISDHQQALKGLSQHGQHWETNSSPLPIDAVFMPVNKVNFSLQVDDQWQDPRERVILEIWTNGSIHPRQAISEAASYLVYLFSLLRQADVWPAPNDRHLLRPHGPNWETVDQQVSRSLQTVVDQNQPYEGSNGGGLPPRTSQNHESQHAVIGTRKEKSTDIADLDLSIQTYVLLKRAGIHTLEDLRSSSMDRIKGGRIDRQSISLEINALTERLALG